jgi:signal transduction histidine kinase
MRELVTNIDATIRQIRTSIFALRGPLGSADGGVRERILQIAAELGAASGCRPAVRFSGAVDLLVTDELADDVVACVRELLSNVARHAQAQSVSADVGVSESGVTIHVADDGIGIPSAGRRSGLANLRHRAEDRGGTLTVNAGSAGGTDAIWKVPL